MLGVSILFHRRAVDWARPVAGTVRAGQDVYRALALAEVRALAATISGPVPTDQSPALAGHGTTPSTDIAPPPPLEWTPVEVGAALMECIAALGPAGAEVIPLAPLRYHDCGTPAPVLLRSIGTKDKIVIDPPLVMNCPMVAALAAGWRRPCSLRRGPRSDRR